MTEVPYTENETAVAHLLMPGIDKVIPIEQIRKFTGLPEREIKAAVEDLIKRHGLKVGSSRLKNGHGYYLIQTAEEADATCRPLERQALSMLRRVALLRGSGGIYVRELMGQLKLALGVTE